MAEQEVEHIQLHDEKTIFYLIARDEDEVPVDLTNAYILDVYFEKPVTGDKVQMAGTLHDGPAGTYKYQLVLGDANEIGLFEIQGYVATPDWRGSTGKGYFYVEGNIINNYWGSLSAFVEGQ
jgi:hypothetical protein